jgi:peptidoglycan/LPS O-acetylase OafA/YrhL
VGGTFPFPGLQKLGDAPYALYLIHPALISVARALRIRAISRRLPRLGFIS